VTAGTTYVASYHTAAGYYSATRYQFENSGVDAPPLHALSAGAASGNGVYIYGGSAFPSNTTTSNYFVDVVFSPPPDTTAPTATPTEPAAGADNVPASSKPQAKLSEAIVAGTASMTMTDPSGASVAGGAAYDAQKGTLTFSPSTSLTAATKYKVTVSGAKDAAGNIMVTTSWTFTTAGVAACPCTLWSSSSTPGAADSGDPNAVELGVKFRSDTDGFVTGVRFYKSAANTGTHTGTLWSATGTKLASATFSQESASGWQTVTFSVPVAVQSGKTYVASYHTDAGHYAVDLNYFNAGVDNSPLKGLATGVDGPNGLYAYGSSGFPDNSYLASNYWVSPVFTTTDTLPPTVVDFSPEDNASSVATSAALMATFNEAVKPASVGFDVRDAQGVQVTGVTSYDSTTKTASFNPATGLSAGASYAVTLAASDTSGNAMTPVMHWSFTTAAASSAGCPCSVWTDSTVPGTKATTDTNAVELGMRFRPSVDGFVSGVRFYKGSGNTGVHTGTLWSNTGTQLATVTFTSESSSGWQQATFSSPVPVTAATAYVISYHTTSGHYSHDGGFFASDGVTSGPLTALADGVAGPNGLYMYGTGGFPSNSSRSSNYWVDVVFNTAQ